MSRRTKWIVAVTGAAVVGGAGVYYVLGTPHYSLYRLGRALQRGDAEGVTRFIDVDRLAASAVTAQVELMAARRGSGRNAWDQMQNDVQARYVQLAPAALLQFAVEELGRSLARLGSGPAAAASAGWRLKGVSRSGDMAHVEIVRRTDGKRVGFDMQWQPDRTWKIVRANPEEMAALMQ